MRILIVYPSDSNITVLEEIAKAKQFTLLKATSLEEARTQIHEHGTNLYAILWFSDFDDTSLITYVKNAHPNVVMIAMKEESENQMAAGCHFEIRFTDLLTYHFFFVGDMPVVDVIRYKSQNSKPSHEKLH